MLAVAYVTSCQTAESSWFDSSLSVMSALEKMAKGVEWGKLDILVVECLLELRLQLSGAVIVSTPQDIALLDARRVLTCLTKLMFRNHRKHELLYVSKLQSALVYFWEGGARRTAAELSLEYLGGIPIEMDIRSCCDEGNPIVISSPDSASARHYTDVAQKVMKRLEELSQKQFHPEFQSDLQYLKDLQRKLHVLTLCL
ncbi:Iron-sulfur protein NUBPL [Bienertia sinuspersici]